MDFIMNTTDLNIINRKEFTEIHSKLQIKNSITSEFNKS